VRAASTSTRSMQYLENSMRILIGLSTVGLLMPAGVVHSSSPHTRTPHLAGHHRATTIAPRSEAAIELPPGYSRGGPLYTTCDRINRDRMLVGTCR
jgi:hypothetical protein